MIIDKIRGINKKSPISHLRDIDKVKSYHDMHKGDRCFIIGNGPSLNLLDLTLLKNEITFGVNAIYTNYNQMGFHVTYYVVEDKFVAEDRADEINQYKESLLMYGDELTYCLSPNKNTVLLNVIYNFRNYFGFPHFSKNIAKKIWVGGTVSYLCMQIAYYMGFDQVYLIGFDHSYEIPDNAEVDGHKIVSTIDNDPNHFNKEYFGKGKRWHDPMLDRMELAYKKAKTYFEDDGRKIVNATVGGKLAIFDRIKYESLFDK